MRCHTSSAASATKSAPTRGGSLRGNDVVPNRAVEGMPVRPRTVSERLISFKAPTKPRRHCSMLQPRRQRAASPSSDRRRALPHGFAPASGRGFGALGRGEFAASGCSVLTRC
jgi:hypothetical protein